MTEIGTIEDRHGETYRAFKVELNPNLEQATSLLKHADAAHFVWNWALGQKKQMMDFNKLPTVHVKIPGAMDLHKELVRLKRGSLSWLQEVSKCAAQEALRDLDTAFVRLWESDFGFPKFKSRKWAKKSYRVNGSIVVADNAIKLPRIGWIKLKERGYIPQGLRVTSATISEQAGRWFVSVNLDYEEQTARQNMGPVVGVDLGILTLATVSDGTTFANPKSLHRKERQLKRTQRAVSRKKNSSANRQKAIRELQRIHVKVANVRKDAINKATTELAKSKSVIVVESLRPKTMVKNHRLAKSLMDAAFGEFVRQLEYKTRWYGSRLVRADLSFPSTKQCSNCGNVKDEMPLAERVYRCDECSLVMGRDLNASINLSRWPLVQRTPETPARVGDVRAERLVADVEAGIIQGQVGLSYLSIK